MNKPLAKKSLVTAFCGAFCFVVLSVMLVRHAWPLWTGEPIYLRVRPVDPRDVFRGDYVILSYPINDLHVSDTLKGDEGGIHVTPVGDWWSKAAGKLPRDSILYLQLEADANSTPSDDPRAFKPVSISDEPLPDVVNLRGRVRRSYESQAFADGRHAVSLTMHYGLDAFYVEEGTGLPIEQALRGGRLVLAEVMVTSGGAARVKDLIIAGNRVSEAR